MAKQAEHNPNERHNRIVEGTRIEGTLISDSNIRIDGQLSGDIQTKGRLVIGPKGKVNGEITCQNAEVEGYIDGTIHVEDLLSLKATARLDGEIHTSKLAIEPGAAFTGSCFMGSKVKQMSNESGAKEAKEKSA